MVRIVARTSRSFLPHQVKRRKTKHHRAENHSTSRRDSQKQPVANQSKIHHSSSFRSSRSYAYFRKHAPSANPAAIDSNPIQNAGSFPYSNGTATGIAYFGIVLGGSARRGIGLG